MAADGEAGESQQARGSARSDADGEKYLAPSAEPPAYRIRFKPDVGDPKVATNLLAMEHRFVIREVLVDGSYVQDLAPKASASLRCEPALEQTTINGPVTIGGASDMQQTYESTSLGAVQESTPMPQLQFRRARPEDAERLEAIRRAAFAPVFASFRSILGEELYDLAQRREDEAQDGMLASLLAVESPWTLYVAQSGEEIVGFVAIHLDRHRHVGEIGLNAVDPAQGGRGIGTAMYELALARMREAGFAAAIPSVWMCRKL